MSNGNTIVGRKRNIDNDFYETPKWATEKAVEAMLIDGVINKYDETYDPCCGTGAITDVLRVYGFENIKASDIQTDKYIKGKKGVDVYDLDDNMTDVVFTNPPYGLMTKDNMLHEFLRISRNKVILLLNIFYLSSKNRKEMLMNSGLKYVYVHSDRVTMHPYGQPKPKNGGTKMYAWFVWDKGYNGEPIIRWL